MIPVEYYTGTYYFVISITLLFIVTPLFRINNLNQYTHSLSRINNILLLIITISFIGLRNPWGSPFYLGDTLSYSRKFIRLSNGDSLIGISDPGFIFLMTFCGKFLNLQFFYFVCGILYVLPIYLAVKKWFGRNAFFAFAMFIVSMSFLNFGINGVRNGIATSIIIYAFSLNKKEYTKLIFFLIAISFHKAVILPVLAYYITFKSFNTNFLIKIWIFMVFFTFFFGEIIETYFQQFIMLNDFANSRRTQNLFVDELNNSALKRGFRLDFIIYSGFPILMGYIYEYKKKINDKFYNRLLHIYIISNIGWLFFIYAAYTNRIAYLSWFIMPLILIYPLLNHKIYKRPNRIIAFFILGSLFFTLILYFK